jgi:hypothetical protein
VGEAVDCLGVEAVAVGERRPDPSHRRLGIDQGAVEINENRVFVLQKWLDHELGAG